MTVCSTAALFLLLSRSLDLLAPHEFLWISIIDCMFCLPFSVLSQSTVSGCVVGAFSPLIQYLSEESSQARVGSTVLMNQSLFFLFSAHG